MLVYWYTCVYILFYFQLIANLFWRKKPFILTSKESIDSFICCAVALFTPLVGFLPICAYLVRFDSGRPNAPPPSWVELSGGRVAANEIGNLWLQLASEKHKQSTVFSLSIYYNCIDIEIYINVFEKIATTATRSILDYAALDCTILGLNKRNVLMEIYWFWLSQLHSIEATDSERQQKVAANADQIPRLWVRLMFVWDFSYLKAIWTNRIKIESDWSWRGRDKRLDFPASAKSNYEQSRVAFLMQIFCGIGLCSPPPCAFIDSIFELSSQEKFSHSNLARMCEFPNGCQRRAKNGKSQTNKWNSEIVVSFQLQSLIIRNL